MTPIQLVQGFTLSDDLYPSDRAAFIQHLNDPDIVANTLAIPTPYREADADWWIGEVRRISAQIGRPMHFALRSPDGTLAGAVGLTHYDPQQPHRVEIGYWLGRPHWGQGIVPAAVRLVCQMAVRQMNVVRVGAWVFMHNNRSVRVLEKCGFIYEGVLHKYQVKNGVAVDVKSFAYLQA